MKDMLNPIPAGEILNEEFLIPMQITPYRIAKEINVSATAIGEIIHGKRGISSEVALKLGKYLGTGADFWINLQKRYELDCAKDKLADEIEKIVPFKIA
ncbi:MAG: HigA family addiction module antitoxin [Treponema sp.]